MMQKQVESVESETPALNQARQSLLWDMQSWQMGRAVPAMGHACLASGTRSLDYGTHSPGTWDAQS
eukprot:2227644-Pyramimonas_sp.AAC.1